MISAGGLFGRFGAKQRESVTIPSGPVIEAKQQIREREVVLLNVMIDRLAHLAKVSNGC